MFKSMYVLLLFYKSRVQLVLHIFSILLVAWYFNWHGILVTCHDIIKTEKDTWTKGIYTRVQSISHINKTTTHTEDRELMISTAHITLCLHNDKRQEARLNKGWKINPQGLWLSAETHISRGYICSYQILENDCFKVFNIFHVSLHKVR